jgi:hypothetical protein
MCMSHSCCRLLRVKKMHWKHNWTGNRVCTYSNACMMLATSKRKSAHRAVVDAPPLGGAVAPFRMASRSTPRVAEVRTEAAAAAAAGCMLPGSAVALACTPLPAVVAEEGAGSMCGDAVPWKGEVGPSHPTAGASCLSIDSSRVPEVFSGSEEVMMRPSRSAAVYTLGRDVVGGGVDGAVGEVSARAFLLLSTAPAFTDMALEESLWRRGASPPRAAVRRVGTLAGAPFGRLPALAGMDTEAVGCCTGRREGGEELTEEVGDKEEDREELVSRSSKSLPWDGRLGSGPWNDK